MAILFARKDTPGTHSYSTLEYAAKEVKMLVLLCREMQLETLEPNPTREEVLEGIARCTTFHFPGHGKSDHREPPQSCLLLKDWQKKALTVVDLGDKRLQMNAPFLGYLSACSTSVNGADESVDEAIHLINAFQLTGFRHVVGALWNVSDWYSVEVAKRFHETLRKEGLNDRAVYRSLHFAVRALCDELMDPGASGPTRSKASSKAPCKAQREVSVPRRVRADHITEARAKGSQGKEADTRALGSSRDSSEADERGDRDAELVEGDSSALVDSYIRFWAPYIHIGV